MAARIDIGGDAAPASSRPGADALTAAQATAVSHSSGPLLVLGGAGTGKSRVLTERFRRLVADGVPPASILLLTERAADRRHTLEGALEAPFEQLSVETFASFTRRLLQAEALEAGLDPFFAAVTPADRLALLLGRIDALALRDHEIRGNPAPLLANFVERIDRLKEEMVTAPAYAAYAEQLSGDAGGDAARAEARRASEFARVYECHEQLLAERGALDTGDLVTHAFRLLHEKPHVRARLAERFRHVLIDEYEDATFAERALVRMLTLEHRCLAVAADEDAAIRRGSGDNVAELRADHPELTVVTLEASRLPKPVVAAAEAVSRRTGPPLRARRGGEVRLWHCSSERAQAQHVAAEAERLITSAGVAPGEILVLVRSVRDESGAVASALEERGLACRVVDGGTYFQRAEVRDVLAWLRLLADPGDSGAVVRALTRPPIELRPVDVARLTQIARRRKLDMIAGIQAALESPQLSPEGRDRALAFMRVYRSASRAFDDLAPDLFVHRLVERIGLRRQQVFAAQARTVERLVNIAKLSNLARGFLQREPGASTRDFTAYLAAVAEAGIAEEEATPPDLPSAIRIMSMDAVKGVEADHVFILGLSQEAFREPRDQAAVPRPLRRGPEVDGDRRLGNLLYLATTRARRGAVLSFAGDRRSPFLDTLDAPEEVVEEQLFGPGEGLHATFRMMRDELLDTVSQVGGRLAEMRLDTYLDVAQATVRYLELLKLAALIERHNEGQDLAQALAEVNGILLQGATAEQRELYDRSALDEYLLDTERDERRRREAVAGRAPEDTLEPFIPRRGDGLMLSASDIETYRLCPLKYKFARVFRIPQEPTINQRFGIVLHQVLERYHSLERHHSADRDRNGGSLDDLMRLFEASWRRGGFGDSSDDMQFREKAVDALRRYHDHDRESAARPAWVERSFAFRLGPHLLRGRVDRVDRLPDGSYELIDYKTGKPKTASELREDVQLSLYQMGARESWGLETSAQSYYYVLDGEKVPVRHSAEELERVRATVADIAERIMSHSFDPQPSPELCAFCDYRIACPAAEK